MKPTETPTKVEEPTPAAAPVAPAVTEPEAAKTDTPAPAPAAPVEPAKTEAARTLLDHTR